MRRKTKENYKKIATNYVVKFIFCLICIYLLYQAFFGVTPSSIVTNQIVKNNINKKNELQKTRERYNEIVHEYDNSILYSNNVQTFNKDQEVNVDITKNQLSLSVPNENSKTYYYHLLMKEQKNQEQRSCPDIPYHSNSAAFSSVANQQQDMLLFPDKQYIEYEFDVHNIDMAYLHLCISNHNYKTDIYNEKYDPTVTDSVDSEFYSIQLTLTSSTSIGSNRGDCDMYLSTTNTNPAPYRPYKVAPSNNTVNTHSFDKRPIIQTASWDWKSNDIGDDSIVLKTTMMEFHLLDHASKHTIGYNAYKDLYIGINKKYQEKNIIRCKLGVTVTPIPKQLLTKSLNLRGKTGRVILPRDIQ